MKTLLAIFAVLLVLASVACLDITPFPVLDTTDAGDTTDADADLDANLDSGRDP